mmetsp:Transcript_17373/g.49734  ORF Transcript_17373/g.49734 Transcript_17373/m.49734 type:complete len:248 (+) Transcript_17373:82-825(+)|eukprot:CAMPEP_0181044272 /NCGR_PEP_ID=MMETSP1070-20121207/13168_1 /TAXON_ID=265543 /ORGANISM="Minutocellus polymorphus, Strain NH13" /LENGTH=247 /DNA_ID=CAMNT_0023122687 /DNA_START=78 /DNA_END=821 /DNA_ORIENTATION=+
MADEQTADFFQPMPDEAAPEVPSEAPPADAPILMGPPPTDDGAPAFAAAPPEDAGFVGDVDATAAPPMMGDAVFVPEPSSEDAAPAFAAAPEDAGAEPIELPPATDEAVPADDGAMILPEPVVPEEPTGPTPMSIWNDEWQVTLKDRKDAENAKKAEALEQAKADLETFQAAREAKREARMKTNRSDEQEKLEALEADIENDNSWQKVCKLVELSHDSADSSADVKRMRDVMILLKNDEKAATTLSS